MSEGTGSLSIAAGMTLHELGDAVGSMGLGAAEDESTSRDGFRHLVELAEDLGLPERSIGMSDDLDLAVAEGSTMVRIGTALFGPLGPRTPA